MTAASRGLAVALLGGGLFVGLAATNPGPAAFADYGGGQVTALLAKDLCQRDGVSGLLRLLIRECPALIQSQRPMLGALVKANTRRQNFGLFSLYHTDLDLAALLPGLRQIPELHLPRYQAITLAGAGQFVLLQTQELERPAKR